MVWNGEDGPPTGLSAPHDQFRARAAVSSELRRDELHRRPPRLGTPGPRRSSPSAYPSTSSGGR
jgi:hypothetical protein